jgi:hypothetical protein
MATRSSAEELLLLSTPLLASDDSTSRAVMLAAWGAAVSDSLKGRVRESPTPHSSMLGSCSTTQQRQQHVTVLSDGAL